MDYEAKALQILRRIHEDPTSGDSTDKKMIAQALREAAAGAYEDAASLIRKYPRCTQDTMIYNYEKKAAALRQPPKALGAGGGEEKGK